MAWNEPGNEQDNEKDPWNDKKRSSKPKDLDDALNQLQKKFSKFVGKKGSQDGDSPTGIFLGIGILIVAILIIWFITGFFVVQPAEKAVVLRFGKYYETLGAGLHWIPRFIDSETKVNVKKVYTYTYPSSGTILMLTKDQNIAAVAITVQFKVEDPQSFLYNTVNPINSLKQATASALRQVVGQTNLDEILTTGREQLRQEVETQLEYILSRYGTGLKVVGVLLKSAQAPEAVKDAFDDAVKAQEDEKRYINQAQAYSMRVEPIAQGKAKRILADAKAYKERVILDAKANVAPFLALLPEYRKAPKVTRERMYLDAMQHVFKNSSKIFVDSGKGMNNLLYLPLQKLLEKTKHNVDNHQLGTGEDNQSTKVPKTASNNTNSNDSTRPTRDSMAFGYGNLGGRQ